MLDTDKHWLYVMYTDEGELIFGCLVHGAEPWAAIPHDKKLYKQDCEGISVNIVQAVLETSSAKQLADSLENESFLKHPLPPLTQDIEFSCMCRHFADGFGRSAKQAVTFAAKHFPSIPDVYFNSLLKQVERDTGVSFSTTPHLLGAFEVFDVPDSGEGHPLVNLEFTQPITRNRQGITAPQGLRLVPADNVSCPLTAHVILHQAGLTVHNGLHVITPGTALTVHTPVWSGFEMSVFNPNGELVQFDTHSLLLHIGMNTQIQGHAIHINDKLTKSSVGMGSQIHNSASFIRPSTTMRSLTGVPDSVFEAHVRKTRHYLKTLQPHRGRDRWFRKGVAHEVKVIEHFKGLLNSGVVKHAVIADPFFGEDALSRMIPRIKNPDLPLTIIASLAKQNPDTDTYDYDIALMRCALNELRSGLAGGVTRDLRFINLVAGTDQAFHDRYLMLELHEGGREIYLLSNSFNRMSGKWPFCMSKLDDAVSLEVGRYLDGLILGQDTTKSSSPVITLNWPNDEQTL
jgi:hypothetical protein